MGRLLHRRPDQRPAETKKEEKKGKADEKKDEPAKIEESKPAASSVENPFEDEKK